MNVVELREKLKAEGIRYGMSEEEKEHYREQQEPNGKIIRVVRMSEVEPEKVTWLWEPYIPAGKITLLEGDPGCGKTWVALAIASTVSTGAAFPDPETGRCLFRRQPANVIYLSAEDGPADTLRPRLDAVKADVSQVYVVTGTQDENGESMFSFEDLALLDGLADSLKPALVVDPLQAYLGAGVDMHRANETRPILVRLTALAERHKCAVICIRHLSKASTSKSIYRGIGSIDFTAAARSVLLAGTDPQNPTSRAIVHIKSSLAPAGQSQGYELQNGFYWTGISELTAAAILGSEAGKSERNVLDEVIDWLESVLSKGPQEKKHIEELAAGGGIKAWTLRRAFEKLQIQSYKKPGEKNGPYIWELPGTNYQNGVVQDGKTGELPQGKNMVNPSNRKNPSNNKTSTGCPSFLLGQTVEVNENKASRWVDGLANECPCGEKDKNDLTAEDVDRWGMHPDEIM